MERGGGGRGGDRKGESREAWEQERERGRAGERAGEWRFSCSILLLSLQLSPFRSLLSPVPPSSSRSPKCSLSVVSSSFQHSRCTEAFRICVWKSFQFYLILFISLIFHRVKLPDSFQSLFVSIPDSFQSLLLSI